MIVRDELRVFVEALAIGMWCRGAGHDLIRDEVEVARRALADDLAGPTRDLQALAAGIAAVAVTTTINELQIRGFAAVPLATAGELIEALPLRLLHDAVIELGETEEDRDR